MLLLIKAIIIFYCLEVNVNIDYNLLLRRKSKTRASRGDRWTSERKRHFTSSKYK